MQKGRIVETDYGFLVISDDGERVAFDKTFTMLASTREIDKPSFANFSFINDDDLCLIKEWYLVQNPKDYRQKQFLTIVEEALFNVDYVYGIALLEPSGNKESIYYKTGSEILTGLTSTEWEVLAKTFCTFGNLKSELANIYELFLWYAYRAAMGYWTLEYICAEIELADEEKESGQIECGGFYDGVLNTYKIVKAPTGSDLYIAGGISKESAEKGEYLFTITYLEKDDEPDIGSNDCGVGVLVLKWDTTC